MENNTNYWKTGVIVTLIFLVGYLAGIGTLVSLHFMKERRLTALRNPAETLTLLTKELNLNQEQRKAVEHIVRQTRRDIFKLRKEARPQLMKLLQQARDEIAVLLNEEQRQQFDQLVEERLKRSMEMRGRMPPWRSPMR